MFVAFSENSMWLKLGQETPKVLDMVSPHGEYFIFSAYNVR